MAAEGYMAIRTWRAGNVVEKIKYWVPGEKPTRSARKLAREARIRADNEHSAERKAARIINENFSWRNRDCLLGGDYSDEALDKLRAGIAGYGEMSEAEQQNALWLAADHELELWIRRARRLAKREGVKVRYFAVTSDMDGKTGELVRVHHHVITNALGAELLRRCWRHGGVFVKELDQDKDYTGLAHYLLAQVRKIGGAKKYKPSRNLRMPQPKDRIALTGAELRVPKGAELLYRGTHIPGRPQYLRYYIGDFTAGG